MAKEEESIDKIDIDDGFNFEDEDLFSGDFDLEPKPIKDDRHVIVKASDSFAKGVVSDLANPTTLRKVVTKALPSELEEVRSFADDNLSKARDVYDRSVDQLRGPWKSFKRSAKAAKRSLGQILPGKMDKWLEQALEDEDTSSIAENKAQLQENQIQQFLAEQMKWQVDQKQEDDIKDEMRYLQEEDQRKKSLELQFNVQSSLKRITDYQDTVTLNYQRKHIELMFRQLNTQVETRDELKLMRTQFFGELQAITKNTALPELVKQRKSELIKDMGFRRLISTAHDSFGDQSRKYMDNLWKNIGGVAQEQIDKFIQGLSASQELLDSLSMAQEMSAMSGDPVYDESDGHRLARGASGLVGGMVGSGIATSLGLKLRKQLEKSERVRKLAERAKNFNENKAFFMKRKLNEGVDGILPAWLTGIMGDGSKDLVNDFLRRINPSMGVGRKNVQFYKSSNLEELAEFNNRTQLTITDIIPGYLARILQSTESARTGVAQPLMVYSHQSGQFVEKKEYAKELAKSIFKPGDAQAVQEGYREMMKDLFGEELQGEEREAFIRYMKQKVKMGEGFNVKDMLNTAKEGEFSNRDTSIDSRFADQWERRLKSRFKYDSASGQLSDEESLLKQQTKLSETFRRKIYDVVPNFNEIVHKLSNQGLNAMDVLQQLGAVQVNGDGSTMVNIDELWTMMEDIDFGTKDNPVDLLDAQRLALAKAKGKFKDGKRLQGEGFASGGFTGYGGKYTQAGQVHRGEFVFTKEATQILGVDRLTRLHEAALRRGQQHHEAAQEKQLKNYKVFDEHPHSTSSTLHDLPDRALTDIRGAVFNIRDTLLSRRQKSTAPPNGQTGYQTLHDEDKSFLTSETDRVVQEIRNSNTILGKIHLMNMNVDFDEATLAKFNQWKEETRTLFERSVAWIGEQASTGWKKAKQAPAWIKGKAMKLSGIAKQGAMFGWDTLKGLGKQVVGVAKGFYSSDIYIKVGEDLKLALSYQKLKMGKYIDASTGKILEHMEEISGPVFEVLEDGSRRLVLDLDDLRTGLFNSLGKRVQLSKARAAINAGIKNIFAFGRNTLNFMNPLQRLQAMAKQAKQFKTKVFGMMISDVYVSGESTPRLFSRAIANGEYFDSQGNVLHARDFENLSSDVYDKDGNVVLTLKEASQGLFDSEGRPYKGLVGKLRDKLAMPLKMGKRILGGIKNVGKNILMGAGQMLNGAFNFLRGTVTFEMYPKYIYELLAWKFGAPEHHAQDLQKGITGPVGRFFSNIFKRGKDKIETLSDKAQSLKVKMEEKEIFEKAKSSFGKFKENFLVTIDGIQKPMWSLSKEERERLKDNRKQAVEAWIQNKKDRLRESRLGKFAESMREGGWRKWLTDKKNKSNEKLNTLAKTTEGGAKGLYNILTKPIFFVGSALLSIFSWFKEGGIMKALTGLGSGLTKVVESIGGIARLLGGIGTSIVSGLGKAAVAVGSATMTVGSAAIKGIGAVASGVGAASSALGLTTGSLAAGTLAVTPIGWAAIGVGLVGFAAYKAWKYFSEKIDDVERLRLLAYGLNPDEQKENANKLLAFEREVWDSCRFKPDGTPIPTEVDWNKWAGFFWHEDSGQPDDGSWNRHVADVQRWYRYRFYPTFVVHAHKLKMIQPGLDIYDIDEKLDDGLKGPYASRILIPQDQKPACPYDFAELPFSNFKAANATYRDVSQQVEYIKQEYHEEEAELRQRAEDSKDPSKRNFNFFGKNNDEAAKALSFEQREKLKDISATTRNGGTTEDKQLVTSNTKVQKKDEKGQVIEMTAEEANYKIENISVINEFEAIMLYLYGFNEDLMKQSKARLMKELELAFLGECTWNKEGLVTDKVNYTDFANKYAIQFGYRQDSIEDMIQFKRWWETRFTLTITGLVKYAFQVDQNVYPERIAKTLDFDQLYEVAKRLISTTFKDPKDNQSHLLRKEPIGAFKGIPAITNDQVYTDLLTALEKRKGEKNLYKSMTKEEREAAMKRFKDKASEEQSRRDKAYQTAYEEYKTERDQRYKRNEEVSQEINQRHQAGLATQVNGVSQAENNNPFGGGDVEIGQGTGDVRGITWVPKGKPSKDMDANWNLIKDLLVQVSKVSGVDVGVLARMAKQESGFNWLAKSSSSSATGLYQFTDDTWKSYAPKISKKYGISNPDRYNPIHNALAAAELLKFNMKYVESSAKKAGFPLDHNAAYLAHFKGPGGAKDFYNKLAQYGDTPVDRVPDMAAEVKANPGIYIKNGRVLTLREGYMNLIGKINDTRANRYASEAYQLIGKQPSKTSDANYGQVQSNPSAGQSNLGGDYKGQSGMSVKFDATQVTDMEQAVNQGTNPALSGKTQSVDLQSQGGLVKPDNSNPEVIGQKVTPTVASGITHGNLAQEGKRLGTDYLANAKEGYDGSQEYFIRQKQSSMGGLPADTDNLDPNVRENLNRMAYEYQLMTGKKLLITTAYRSTEQQRKLYEDPRYKASKPGFSLHEYGVAIDIKPEQNAELEKLGLMSRYGFYRPLPGNPKEKQHIQPESIKKVPALSQLANAGDTGDNLPSAVKKMELNSPSDIQLSTNTLNLSRQAAMGGIASGYTNSNVNNPVISANQAPSVSIPEKTTNTIHSQQGQKYLDMSNLIKQARANAEKHPNWNKLSVVEQETLVKQEEQNLKLAYAKQNGVESTWDGEKLLLNQAGAQKFEMENTRDPLIQPRSYLQPNPSSNLTGLSQPTNTTQLNQAGQVQQSIIQIDKTLTAKTEQLLTEQLTVLKSIDTKFDEALSLMKAKVETKPTEVGSPRQFMQQTRDVSPAAISMTRPV